MTIKDKVKKNNKRKNRRFHLFPESAGLLVVMQLVLIAEIIFLSLVCLIDILPVKYLVLLLILLFLCDGGLVLLLNSRKKRTNKPLVGVILSVLLINVLLLGCNFLYNTYDTLQKISEEKSQYEEYHVVVLNKSKYERVKQIEGMDVYVSDMESKMYNEAKERLLTKVDVVYQTEPDIMTVGSHLIDEKGKAHNEIIFISDGNYEMLCEEIESFEEKTRKLYSISVAIRADDSSKSIDVTKDPFNVYITGIDVWGSIDKVSRSDVNMIVTVNPQTKTILMTSIPRDSYVKLHSYGQMDKLTHSGVYGVEETVSTVEDWVGVDMNYYTKVNFSMLVGLVDAIGGIVVESDFAFKSKISDYTYVVGPNKMTGAAALYFARERKAFEDEDEERIRNQQKVLKATLEKITRSEVILMNYVDILNAVEGSMQTNMSDKQMSALVKMQLKDMSKWDIRSISIDGNDAMKGTYTMGMGRELFVSVPDPESVQRAAEEIHNVMYPAKIDHKKNENNQTKTE